MSPQTSAIMKNFANVSGALEIYGVEQVVHTAADTRRKSAVKTAEQHSGEQHEDIADLEHCLPCGRCDRYFQKIRRDEYHSRHKRRKYVVQKLLVLVVEFHKVFTPSFE